MCDLEDIGSPSKIKSYPQCLRRTPCGGSGTGHDQFTQVELLKLQKSGQFPDESVRIKDTQIHHVNGQTY